MPGMTTNMPNLNTFTVAVQTESQTMSPSTLSITCDQASLLFLSERERNA